MSQEQASLTDIPSLVSSILSDARALVKIEIAMAKREFSNGVSTIVNGIVLFVVAGAFGLVALFLFGASAAFGFNHFGLPMGWAVFASGASFVLIAAILALYASKAVKLNNLSPKRAMDNFHADMDAIRDARHAEHD